MIFFLDSFDNDKEMDCCSRHVTIGNHETHIGYEAFYRCSWLKSVTIPNSVTHIGDGAFYGCSGLTSVAIPKRVTKIGKQVFFGGQGGVVCMMACICVYTASVVP